MLAAMLAQGAAHAPDPCNAAGQPVTPRPGCPGWRYVGQRDIGTHYVDPASLRREGDTFEIDSRVVLVSALEGRATSFTGRNRYNCANRLVTLLVTRIWDSRGAMLREEVHRGQYASSTVDESQAGYDFDVAMLRDYCPHPSGTRGANR